MSLCSGMCLPAGVTLLKLASDPSGTTTSTPVLPDKPTFEETAMDSSLQGFVNTALGRTYPSAGHISSSFYVPVGGHLTRLWQMPIHTAMRQQRASSRRNVAGCVVS
jgi:hypothetical protein